MIPKVKYRIASFNIRQFSNNSVSHGSGTDSKKDLETIARIINDNEIDIIAIQEIRGKIAFKELLTSIAYGYSRDITAEMLEQPAADGNKKLSSELMGSDYLACSAGKWQGRWTHPNSKWGTAIAEEGYAFIWNSDKFELPQNDRGRVQPVIKHKKEIYFIRPPFYGRFVTKNTGAKFEIRLLNTHVLYTKNAKLKKLRDSGIDIDMLESYDSKDRMEIKQQMLNHGLSPLEVNVLEKFASQDDIERRKSEVRNLVNEILTREEDDKKYGSYVFMLGDYNLNLKSEKVPYKNRTAIIEDKIIYAPGNINEIKEYIITQNGLSTLKSPPQKDQESDMEYKILAGENRFANNYDHFTYNINMTSDDGRGIYIGEAKRIDVLSKYGITNRDYFERISDHLPIIMEIGF